MYPSQEFPSQLILPAEFEVLSEVFEQLLTDCDATRDSNQAEALAVRLFELYRSGMRDVRALRGMAKLFG